tara:strand:+ start:148 stop:2121 length:1974 start_codon:yes stop_codon:yes gene_type:complete
MAGLGERLVTQSTVLRDLKFGKDRPGGGSSKEPFVNRNTLPPVVAQSPDIGLLGGNTDFLLRAGTLKRSADDVSRMTQLLLTTGKGVAFTAKQNLLSRTNVKTQAKSIGLNQGPYIPTSTIAQVASSGLGFHLNKQGINPFAKTGVGSGNDGSGGNLFENIVAAGSLPTYLSANIKGGDTGDTNRLVQLSNTKFYTKNNQEGGLLSAGSKLLSNAANLFGGPGKKISQKITDSVSVLATDPALAANSISADRNQILAYGGGPGAEIGVGRTIIGRYTDTSKYNDPAFRKKYYLLDGGNISGLSDESENNRGKIQKDFRKLLLDQQKSGDTKSILSDSTDYETKNLELRVGLNNPGKNNKDVTSYTKGLGTPLDLVNALPLYSSKGVTINTDKNDLIKFRIAAYNPHDDKGRKTYIHFRAFLDSFQDNYTSEWESFKYMGRTEQFHKYQGFQRSVSFSWKIAAQSRDELIPMYKKLNYLQSIMAGDYSPSGYMEGNLVDLTIGGYFWEQPGFFTSLNTTFPDKSTYEIGIPDNVSPSERNRGQSIDTSKSVKELPHYLEVSAVFTPIEKFAPRKQQNKFDNNGGLEEYGQERFINLSSEGGASSYQDTAEDYFNPKSTVAARLKPAGIKPFDLSPPSSNASLEGLKALANKKFSNPLS